VHLQNDVKIVFDDTPDDPGSHAALAARLMLNDGVIAIQPSGQVAAAFPDGFYFPKEAWRPPSAAEISLLVANARKTEVHVAAALFRFFIPEEFHTRFWELDIEKLLVESELHAEVQQAYQIFTTDLICYMIENLGFSVSGNCSCTTMVNKPSLQSTRYHSEYSVYTGLDIDNLSQTSIQERHLSLSTAYINLSDEPGYILFINLTLIHMYKILTLKNPDILYQDISPSQIAKMFMNNYPRYPVIKLTVNPCEGFLIPTENVVYDFSTMGKRDIDIILLIHSIFNI
jgi:hypothetical protein